VLCCLSVIPPKLQTPLSGGAGTVGPFEVKGPRDDDDDDDDCYDNLENSGVKVQNISNM
jgi:hypothetical protein